VSLPEPSPSIAASVCPLCASATTASDERCPSCGLALAGVDGRPGPFSRTVLWWSVAGFAAVYLATLAIVVVTR
jgi:predicted amidophosphoribosyltransferase